MAEAKSFLGAADVDLNLDTFIAVKGAAAAGTVVNTTAGSMTVSPETTQEDGYIRVTIGGVDYQIPIYAA